MPVPTTWVTAPSASVRAVFDHSISRSSPSRVRQWNSIRTGDSPALSASNAATTMERSSRGTRLNSPPSASKSAALYPESCSQARFQRTREPTGSATTISEVAASSTASNNRPSPWTGIVFSRTGRHRLPYCPTPRDRKPKSATLFAWTCSCSTSGSRWANSRLPRAPGLGVGRARRRLVRGDDEPPARPARAARRRGSVLVAPPRSRRARLGRHPEGALRDARRLPGRGGPDALPRRPALAVRLEPVRLPAHLHLLRDRLDALRPQPHASEILDQALHFRRKEP